jgi:cation diffusion facilitator CzcD-associated flavoprotein CzcO
MRRLRGVMNDEILIIGCGFAGLGMGVRLKRAKIESFTLLERAAEIGGTWRDNQYPGCACDVQSQLYSYSFEPNAGWSRAFAEQGEIREYLRRCADKYGLRRHIRFGQEVTRASFDDARCLWTVETSSGDTYRARVVVSAMGALSNPAYPTIPGMERFEGERFHSATWNRGYDFAGKRVAVIGSGASAIQFVPQIAPKVERLDIYQRTPPWILPKPDRTIGSAERAIYRSLPIAQKLVRWCLYWELEARVLAFAVHPALMRAVAWQARRHIRRSIEDRELRAKLTPEYTVGCKRVLISNDYYGALARPNVSVVTDGIREIRARSVVDQTGHERDVDAIVFATGFQAQDPVRRGMIFGRRGQDLVDAWHDGPEAYKGTTVAGFPNLFLLLGPNTGLGHSSVLFMIESQIAYVMDALRQMRANDWLSLDVQPDAQSAFNHKLKLKSAKAVWQSGCKSWYLTESGRNTTMWPDFSFRFRQLTRNFDASAYRVLTRDTVRQRAKGSARTSGFSH